MLESTGGDLVDFDCSALDENALSDPFGAPFPSFPAFGSVGEGDGSSSMKVESLPEREWKSTSVSEFFEPFVIPFKSVSASPTEPFSFVLF